MSAPRALLPLLPLLPLVFALACCHPAAAPQQPAPSQPAPSPSPPSAGQATDGDASSSAAAPAPTGGVDGDACASGDDCASGVCEGEGCGDTTGVCVGRARPCTRDLQAFCGCDGVTFRASSSCPGRRYAHRGPCP